ncbi:MAG: PH domain-containing protein, partial [Duncaniella sp.]|nr:PH domain-containing protein [Duncaniella sp.]
YALRGHAITYRGGVIFSKITTVPFARIQQVSIKQGPISRYFGLCAIDIVNGAQGLSSLTIQGLTKEKADAIKNAITQRLNNNHD